MLSISSSRKGSPALVLASYLIVTLFQRCVLIFNHIFVDFPLPAALVSFLFLCSLVKC